MRTRADIRAADTWSPTARMNAIIVAVAMAVIGWIAAGKLVDLMQAHRLVETRAVVLHKGVGGGGRSGWHPEVRYRYRVDGRTYEGTRLDLGAWSYGGPENIERMLLAYPVGSTVRAWYDPRRPDVSVLRNEGSLLGNLVLTVLCLGGSATAVWLRFFRRIAPRGVPERGAHAAR